MCILFVVGAFGCLWSLSPCLAYVSFALPSSASIRVFAPRALFTQVNQKVFFKIYA